MLSYRLPELTLNTVTTEANESPPQNFIDHLLNPLWKQFNQLDSGNDKEEIILFINDHISILNWLLATSGTGLETAARQKTFQALKSNSPNQLPAIEIMNELVKTKTLATQIEKFKEFVALLSQGQIIDDPEWNQSYLPILKNLPIFYLFPLESLPLFSVYIEIISHLLAYEPYQSYFKDTNSEGILKELSKINYQLIEVIEDKLAAILGQPSHFAKISAAAEKTKQLIEARAQPSFIPPHLYQNPQYQDLWNMSYTADKFNSAIELLKNITEDQKYSRHAFENLLYYILRNGTPTQRRRLSDLMESKSSLFPSYFLCGYIKQNIRSNDRYLLVAMKQLKQTERRFYDFIEKEKLNSVDLTQSFKQLCHEIRVAWLNKFASQTLVERAPKLTYTFTPIEYRDLLAQTEVVTAECLQFELGSGVYFQRLHRRITGKILHFLFAELDSLLAHPPSTDLEKTYNDLIKQITLYLPNELHKSIMSLQQLLVMPYTIENLEATLNSIQLLFKHESNLKNWLSTHPVLFDYIPLTENNQRMMEKILSKKYLIQRKKRDSNYQISYLLPQLMILLDRPDLIDFTIAPTLLSPKEIPTWERFFLEISYALTLNQDRINLEPLAKLIYLFTRKYDGNPTHTHPGFFFILDKIVRSYNPKEPISANLIQKHIEYLYTYHPAQLLNNDFYHTKWTSLDSLQENLFFQIFLQDQITSEKSPARDAALSKLIIQLGNKTSLKNWYESKLHHLKSELNSENLIILILELNKLHQSMLDANENSLALIENQMQISINESPLTSALKLSATYLAYLGPSVSISEDTILNHLFAFDQPQFKDSCNQFKAYFQGLIKNPEQFNSPFLNQLTQISLKWCESIFQQSNKPDELKFKETFVIFKHIYSDQKPCLTIIETHLDALFFKAHTSVGIIQELIAPSLLYLINNELKQYPYQLSRLMQLQRITNNLPDQLSKESVKLAIAINWEKHNLSDLCHYINETPAPQKAEIAELTWLHFKKVLSQTPLKLPPIDQIYQLLRVLMDIDSECLQKAIHQLLTEQSHIGVRLNQYFQKLDDGKEIWAYLKMNRYIQVLDLSSKDNKPNWITHKIIDDLFSGFWSSKKGPYDLRNYMSRILPYYLDHTLTDELANTLIKEMRAMTQSTRYFFSFFPTQETLHFQSLLKLLENKSHDRVYAKSMRI